jgi:hypothetical protein
MGWLHFVDKTKYFRAGFVKEAEALGIARRVPLDTLKEMQWGEMVTCAMVKGEIGVTSPVMFLEFPISHVTGIGAWAVAQFLDMYPCRPFDIGGDLIMRQTCVYATGTSYRVDATLQEVAEYLETLESEPGAEIGSPMVGCENSEVRRIKTPFPIIRGMTAAPGFLPFDSEKVENAIHNWRSQGKRPQLSECFKLKKFDRSIRRIVDETYYPERDFEGQIRGIRNLAMV